MSKPFYMSLMKVCFIVAQTIAILCEEKKGPSLALLSRQKRSSPLSGLNPELLPERASRTRQPTEGPIPEKVKVMRGTEHVGFGIVVHPRVIAAKNGIFHSNVQHHVEFLGSCEDTVVRLITEIIPSNKFNYLREPPGATFNVALAVTDGPMPEHNDLLFNRLYSAGNFSTQQIWCILKMLEILIEHIDV